MRAREIETAKAFFGHSSREEEHLRKMLPTLLDIVFSPEGPKVTYRNFRPSKHILGTLFFSRMAVGTPPPSPTQVNQSSTSVQEIVSLAIPSFFICRHTGSKNTA